MSVGGQPPSARDASGALWWPWLDWHRQPAALREWGPALTIICVLVLVGCWLRLLRLARRREIGTSAVLLAAGCWGAPLLFGPPVLSADAYSYLAQGTLLQRGLDPYRFGAAVSSHIAGFSAVDARWRGLPSPYGPLALQIYRLAAAVGGIGGLMVLRLAAVLALAVTATLILRIAAPATRAWSVALVAANPLMLLHGVGGAHVDAVMTALLVGGLAFSGAGRAPAGIALVVAAVAVKVTAVVALPPLLLAVTPWRARRLLTALAVGVASAGGCLLLVPDPLGWIRGLTTPGSGRTGDAPTEVLALVIRTFTSADRSTALLTGRVLGMTVAVVLICALLRTCRRRPPAATAGYCLLAVVLLGPVFYAWYLIGPIGCLAVVVGDRVAPWLIGCSVAACATSLPSLHGSAAADRLGAAGLVGIAILAITVVAAAERDNQRQRQAQGGAGDRNA